MIPLRRVHALAQDSLATKLAQAFVEKVASERRRAYAARSRLRIK
jgi:hypothetical protein